MTPATIQIGIYENNADYVGIYVPWWDGVLSYKLYASVTGSAGAYSLKATFNAVIEKDTYPTRVIYRNTRTLLGIPNNQDVWLKVTSILSTGETNIATAVPFRLLQEGFVNPDMDPGFEAMFAMGYDPATGRAVMLPVVNVGGQWKVATDATLVGDIDIVGPIKLANSGGTTIDPATAPNQVLEIGHLLNIYNALQDTLGEVQVNPTTFTVLERLKVIATLLSSSLVVQIDQTNPNNVVVSLLKDSAGNGITSKSELAGSRSLDVNIRSEYSLLPYQQNIQLGVSPYTLNFPNTTEYFLVDNMHNSYDIALSMDSGTTWKTIKRGSYISMTVNVDSIQLKSPSGTADCEIVASLRNV